MSTPANPMTGQLPVADPQRVAQLVSLFPQSAPAGGAPAPAAPAPGPTDITQEMVQASQQGRQIFGEQVGRERSIADQIQDLVRQQQATPIPKTGFLDPQGQPQKGGFLHSLGRALTAIGAATAPGAAIERAVYEPGLRRYGAETGARAKQIEELQSQEQREEQLGGAAAGMVSKPITAAGSVLRGEAAVSRAQVYKDTVAPTQAKALLAGIDLKRAAQDEKARHDLATELQAKANMMAQEYMTREKITGSEDVAGILAGSREAIANEVAARNPSLWQQLQVELGWGATPQLPAAQPAQTPPNQAKPGAAPARPKNVPADAHWNSKTRHWEK